MFLNLHMEVVVIRKMDVPRDIRKFKVHKHDILERLVSTLEHMHVQIGQDKVSGGVRIPCWHATSAANALWKPMIFDKQEAQMGLNPVQGHQCFQTILKEKIYLTIICLVSYFLSIFPQNLYSTY